MQSGGGSWKLPFSITAMCTEQIWGLEVWVDTAVYLTNVALSHNLEQIKDHITVKTYQQLNCLWSNGGSSLLYWGQVLKLRNVHNLQPWDQGQIGRIECRRAGRVPPPNWAVPLRKILWNYIFKKILHFWVRKCVHKIIILGYQRHNLDKQLANMPPRLTTVKI